MTEVVCTVGATYPRTAASPPRTAASPPVNGGNCTIRGATRRRHAEGRLLMLQNPPSSPGCGGVAGVNCVPESPASQNIWAITPMLAIVRRGGLHRGRHIPANRGLTAPNRGLTATKRGELRYTGTPCVTCLSVTSPSNGGNCTIRGATRRRHAEGRLLMLQNPPSSSGCGGVAGVNCVPESPASQNIWAIMPMLAIVRRGCLHCGRRCPEA